MSGIAEYEYSLGLDTGQTEIVDWTSAGLDTSITIGNISLDEGPSYYANVRAYDAAGNMSSVESSDGITADLSSPTVGWVFDGLGEDETFTASQTTVEANWGGFADTTSGIQHYEYAVGTTAGGSDVTSGWVSAGTNTSISADLTLNETVTYYFSIRAVYYAASVGRSGVQHHALDRGNTRRALRGHGAARSAGRSHA